MFDVLIGSSGRRERKLGRGVVSAVLHIAAIAGVAKATASADLTGSAEPRIFDIDIAAPLVSQPSTTTPMRVPSDLVASPAPVAMTVVPIETPVGIPPIALNDRWSPHEVVLGASPIGVPGVLVGVGTANGDSVRSESSVDEPASVLLQRSPRYPPSLQAAGLEGRVSVRFVIDTEGRAEPGSLGISSSSHAGFEASARETILKTVFRPARVKGRAVRQWAEQAVVFRIAP